LRLCINLISTDTHISKNGLLVVLKLYENIRLISQILLIGLDIARKINADLGARLKIALKRISNATNTVEGWLSVRPGFR
jgi:hypothetical protein